LEKLNLKYPMKAMVVKKCNQYGISYLEGNKVGEFIDDIKVVIPFLWSRFTIRSSPLYNRVRFP
jgi:hypothetical protein